MNIDNEIMVSVICDAYNHEEYIRDALNSIINQKTNFKFEILVHDDCSTDNTAKIIKEYEEKYPDIIKPIYQKENKYQKGISVDKEYQLPRAKGKYFAYCEGDDYWIDEYKLQRQFDFMQVHSEYSLCVHNAIVVNKNKRKILEISPVKKDGELTCKDMVLGGGQYIATNSIFSLTNYYRELLNNISDFDLDYMIQIYLSSVGRTFCFCDKMSAYRKGVNSSYSYKYIRDEKYSIEISKKMIDSLQKIYFKINDNDKKYIKDEIIRQEIILYRKTGDLTKLKNEPYKSYVKTLPILEKIAVFFRINFPKIYKILKNMCIKIENCFLYK